MDTYNEAFQDAVARAARLEQVRAIRNRELYRTLPNTPPQARVNVERLHTPAQYEAAKLAPFWRRSKEQRLAIF